MVLLLVTEPSTSASHQRCNVRMEIARIDGLQKIERTTGIGKTRLSYWSACTILTCSKCRGGLDEIHRLLVCNKGVTLVGAKNFRDAAET